MVGKDVEAVRRGSIRYLSDDLAWARYMKQTTASRRTFGPGMRALVTRVQHKARVVEDGKAGATVNRVLRKNGAYDVVCDALLSAYAASRVDYCYPHPLGANSSICQGLHVTAGLPGNWAIDFCAPGTTLVLAVVQAEVVKISGHPPTYVVDGATGIFGWNLHYVTADGYRWFSTHYGELLVREGQRVTVGQPVGRVGRWPGSPSRSHTHLGVTSPKGWLDAQRMIEKVAHAPRVAA